MLGRGKLNADENGGPQQMLRRWMEVSMGETNSDNCKQTRHDVLKFRLSTFVIIPDST